jgi:hypothetical protein
MNHYELLDIHVILQDALKDFRKCHHDKVTLDEFAEIEKKLIMDFGKVEAKVKRLYEEFTGYRRQFGHLRDIGPH